jgi:uncharacterized membrane protein HdeD (DUF308 family)
VEIIAFLLVAHRWLTGFIGTISLAGGTLFWGPVAGLWLAMLLIGVLSVIGGAAIHTLDLRHKANHLVTGLLTDREANAVKVSGIAYVSVCMVAGWFGATAVLIVCALMMIDFFAGNRLARHVDGLL